MFPLSLQSFLNFLLSNANMFHMVCKLVLNWIKSDFYVPVFLYTSMWFDLGGYMWMVNSFSELHKMILEIMCYCVIVLFGVYVLSFLAATHTYIKD